MLRLFISRNWVHAGCSRCNQEHPTSKHAIKIARRCCRFELVSCYEQARQVCDVPICLFGIKRWEATNNKDALEDEAAYKDAFGFMVELAQRFLKNEFDRDDFKAEKNKVDAEKKIGEDEQLKVEAVVQQTEI